MFTMAKIKNGGTYLSRHLTANDYYCEKETVVGEWIGQGAEKLGLNTGIQAHDAAFENLRNNHFPDGSGKLTPYDRKERVRFFDFQCSAQKSISVMAVTMGDRRLLAAHDAAARLAFGELEKFAARQMNTAIKRANLRTSNVVAAAFRHTASRALDPQVHTHFVTANATWDPRSNTWRALTEFEMVSAIRYAGKVYQNEMARSCLALGYDIAEIRDFRGTVTGFEIAGVSPEIRQRFSKRRAEVELGVGEFLKENGREPTPAEIHVITKETGNAKLAETTTAAVLATQRAQLSAPELQALEGLKTLATARIRAEITLPHREGESLRTAVAHVYERRSVVAGHEVLAEALNQNLGQIELRHLHEEAQRSELIGLTNDPWLHEKFATRQGLAVEKWAVDFVDRKRQRFGPLGGEDVELAPHLSEEQREAAAAVLASRDQVVCLRGAAGVGKSTVLREINRGLAQTGVSVFCCAPTSSAADTLRKDGLAVTTVSDFLQNVVPRDRSRLLGAILICDEAGLTSNHQGAELLRVAERYSARVLFLGDSRQHTAVEAGDFLRVLEAHSKLHRVELTAIRRQRDKAYRHAVHCLATGATRFGLERLNELGWVKEGRAGYLREAAGDFLGLSADGLERVLAVTPTWAEHEVFTTELRSQLKARGTLGPGETVTVHDPMNWTRAQMKNARNFAPGMVVTFNRTIGDFQRGEFFEVSRITQKNVFVRTAAGDRSLPPRSDAFSVARPRCIEIAAGDRLLVRANDRSARVLNGELVNVARINGGVIQTTDGRSIDTRRFRALVHGFAVTSHASQSKTVEHVVVAAERLNAKAAYVACSRGQLSCTVHTPDKAALLERLPDGNRTAPLDLIGAEYRANATPDRTGIWARLVGRPAREFVGTAHRLAASVGIRRGIGLKESGRLGHAQSLNNRQAPSQSVRL